MVEKIAIIIMALINQSNMSSSDMSGINFLDLFINEGFVENANADPIKSNWDYYIKNVSAENALETLPLKKKDASDIEIESKSAVVMDAGTNSILFSKEENRKMPIASITKLMTAMVAIDKIDLSDKLTVSKEVMKNSGNSNGLYAGEEIVAGDLMKIMLVNSNNIAAEAIARSAGGSSGGFIESMNEKAALLGLGNTKFFNASGLDGEEENYSTALEVAKIFDYSLRYPEIWEILRIQRSEVWSFDKKTKHVLKNTNQLLGGLKNIEGGKTGFTDDAGECLALVIGDPDENHKIVSVVLNSSDRFKDTEKVVKWVFDNYTW